MEGEELFQPMLELSQHCSFAMHHQEAMVFLKEWGEMLNPSPALCFSVATPIQDAFLQLWFQTNSCNRVAGGKQLVGPWLNTSFSSAPPETACQGKSDT